MLPQPVTDSLTESLILLVSFTYCTKRQDVFISPALISMEFVGFLKEDSLFCCLRTWPSIVDFDSQKEHDETRLAEIHLALRMQLQLTVHLEWPHPHLQQLWLPQSHSPGHILNRQPHFCSKTPWPFCWPFLRAHSSGGWFWVILPQNSRTFPRSRGLLRSNILLLVHTQTLRIPLLTATAWSQSPNIITMYK